MFLCLMPQNMCKNLERFNVENYFENVGKCDSWYTVQTDVTLMQDRWLRGSRPRQEKEMEKLVKTGN